VKSLVALYHRSFAVKAIVGFLAAAALLAVLGLFTVNSHLEIPKFDGFIRAKVQSIASPGLTSTMRVLTRLGSTVGLTAIGVVVIAVFLYMRRLKYIGLLLLAMAGQGILQYSFKTIFERQRPQAMFDYVIGDTPSFPSGHALAATCFFGLLAYLITVNLSSTAQKIAVWLLAVIIILTVGFSRIYFDVHYPSDVIAGYLAGTIWVSSLASGARS
jgi:membrane-associated phospholipid phosphatase